MLKAKPEEVLCFSAVCVPYGTITICGLNQAFASKSALIVYWSNTTNPRVGSLQKHARGVENLMT